MKKLALIILLLLFITNNSKASDFKAISPEFIIENVSENFLVLDQLKQKVIQSEQDLLTKKGAFDLKLNLKSNLKPLGYYQNGYLNAYLEQPTQFYGASFFGGYDYGQGSFPSYYGNLETNNLGELNFGVDVPFLKGFFTDVNRTDLNKAGLDIKISQLKYDSYRIKTLSKAIKSYWLWVEQGKNLLIAQDLLNKAKVRTNYLNKGVELGVLAPVELVENEKAILKRNYQVNSEKQNFLASSNNLLFFIANDSYSKFIKDTNYLPSFLNSEKSSIDLESSLNSLIMNRPEILSVDFKQKQNKLDLGLNKNNLLPKLNFKLFVSKDIGDEKKYSKSPTELNAYLNFSYPLQNRKATGKLEKIKSKQLEIDLQKEFAIEQLSLELKNLINNINFTYEQVEIIKKEIEVLDKLEEIEIKLLELGNSDLFKVNLREQYTAEAKKKLIKVITKYNSYLYLYNIAMLKY